MKYEIEINLSYERNRAKLKTKYAADNNEDKQENNDAGEEPHMDKRVSVQSAVVRTIRLQIGFSRLAMQSI